MKSTLKRFLVTSSSLLGFQLQSGCGAPATQTSTALPTPGASALPIAAPPTNAPASIGSAANAPTLTAATAALSPFHIVATGSNLQLIESEGDLILFDGSQLLAKVEGDRIVNHPEYLASLPVKLGFMQGSIALVGGKWPEAGWVSVTRIGERTTGYSVFYEKIGQRWQFRSQTSLMQGYAGIQDWDKGRRIALVSGVFGSYRWEVLHGTTQGVPKPQKDTSCKDPDECGNRDDSAQMPIDFASLKSGHLFAVGPLQTQDRSWVVERWEPNHIKSQLDKLPMPANPALMPTVNGIAAFAPNDVYVFGQLDPLTKGSKGVQENVGAYLAHFDGSNWTNAPFTSNCGITSMSAADGALWATSGGSLWKRRDSKANWETIALPSIPAELAQSQSESTKKKPTDLQLAASHVWARGGGDLWVESIVAQKGYCPSTSDRGDVVLRNRPHSELWHNLEGDKNVQAVEKYQPLRPASEGCQSIFVLLYGMTRTTPKDYDYPLTRAALKGHPEFTEVKFAETVDRGQHYFGAFVPDIWSGQKLLAIVHEKVKDSKPVMLCRHPKKVRLLEFDMATGAVTKNAKVDE